MLPFQIVDSHLHLWDPERFSYPWMKEDPALQRGFGLSDLDEAKRDVMIEKIVFVQADCLPAQALDEAQWVQSLAENDSRLAGIVAWAPMETGNEARAHLDKLREMPLVKGVRRILQWEDDAAFCLQDRFIEGVRALPDYGYTFDICIFHHQLENVVEMVRRCPDVTFILDHIGKPDIKNRVFEPWREQIAALAALPNVHCKISGLVTEADHENWKPFRLKPYIDHAVECFSFDRVMFGSDWPVATLAAEYPQWIEALSWATEDARESEMMKLYRNNALAVYGLE